MQEARILGVIYFMGATAIAEIKSDKLTYVILTVYIIHVDFLDYFP